MPRQVTRRFRGTTVIDNLRIKNVRGGPFDEIGRVYHINTAGALFAGDDANSGLEYEHPMLTITGALGRCVSGRNDYILIHDYWRPATETFPIQVNKKKVHILGVAQPNFPYPAVHPGTDVAAFAVNESGSYSEIGLLTIGGGNSYAGISLGAVTGVNTKPEGILINGCIFGHSWFGTPLSGIDSPQYGAMGAMILDCTFLGDLINAGGKITGNAIDFTTAVAGHEGLQILGCKFAGVAIAINLYRGQSALIQGNTFAVPDAQNGEAVTLQSDNLGVMVKDNEAINGMLSAGYTFNPYRDLSADPANHWGRNYRGNAVIEPVGI